jgi:DNA repair protein RadC
MFRLRPRDRCTRGDAVVRYRLTTVQITLAQEPAVQLVASPAMAEVFFRAILADLDADWEHFILIALDAQLQACGYKVVATGGQNQTVVDPRTLFRDALLLGAAALVLGHNHPSGDPTPSGDDLKLTRQLVQAGQLLGVRVHDHLILGGPGRFASLAALGQLS